MKISKALAGMLLILALGAAWAAADDLEAVQQAIRDQGLHWTAGPSIFTDGQFRALLGNRLSDRLTAPAPQRYRFDLPASFDWRNENAVTAVRDQNPCGCCWAFSTVGALESAALRAKGYPVALELSPQELVSCDNQEGGCYAGGDLWYALSYLQFHGTVDESCYPYAGQNESCSPCQNWQSRVYLAGQFDGVQSNVDELKQAVYQKGPLSVTMEVYSDFEHYQGGVYAYSYGSDLGGHAILMVGWDDGANCFIVKNSWGMDWGEAGYFRIAYSEVGGKSQFAQEAFWVEFGSGPVCDAASCPNGCCDVNSQCQTGAADTSCGKGGVWCVDCTASFETCHEQVCADKVCNSSTCYGCCDAKMNCQPGSADAECGVGGATCVDCSASDKLCEPTQGVCEGVDPPSHNVVHHTVGCG